MSQGALPRTQTFITSCSSPSPVASVTNSAELHVLRPEGCQAAGAGGSGRTAGLPALQSFKPGAADLGEVRNRSVGEPGLSLTLSGGGCPGSGTCVEPDTCGASRKRRCKAGGSEEHRAPRRFPEAVGGRGLGSPTRAAHSNPGRSTWEMRTRLPGWRPRA